VAYFPSNISFSLSAKGAIENGFWMKPSALASKISWVGPSMEDPLQTTDGATWMVAVRLLYDTLELP